MRYWIIALVALAVVGGGLYYLRQNLDSIVANEIEAVGTDALGTRVHVGSVELDLRAGSGTIRDLRVENPQGFSDRRMVSIDEIALTIDVSSALAVASGSSEHVVIKRLSIRDPRVSVVTDRNGRTNLQSVQAHLGGATSSSPAGSGPQPAPSTQRAPRTRPTLCGLGCAIRPLEMRHCSGLDW